MAPHPTGQRCPICGRPVELTAPEFPFCSQRCRTIDLGNWANEKYVVPVPLTEDDESS